MHGYIALVTKTSGGYSAFFPDLPDCRSDGASVDGAITRARSALKAHAARLHRAGEAMPAPRPAMDVFAEEAKYDAVGGACIELRDISLRIAVDRKPFA